MTTEAEPSDADLVRRTLAGEDRAFTLLMRRHKGGLFGFTRRYVGEVEPALEIVHETFVSGWTALRRYDGSRPFGVWLRTIALNKCRDRGRRQAVRRLVFGAAPADAAAAAAEPDAAPPADEALVAVERARALNAAVARLPAALKEPLILTWFDGLSQQEAAEVLGIGVRQVEARAYRARRKLAELLESAGV